MPKICSERPRSRRIAPGQWLGAFVLIALLTAQALFCAHAAGPSKLEYTVPAVSPLAQKRLESASDFVAVRQWTEAFQVMEEVAREHQGALVEVEPDRWIAVPRRIAELTAGLPQEGLDAYRRRVDPQAAALLREAGPGDAPDEETGSAPLKRIVDEFFASSAGDDAIRRLGAIRWRKGDPAGARELWSRLLPVEMAGSRLRYPDGSDSPAAVLARLALCDLLLGDRLAADRRIAILRERFPDASGSVGGQPGRFADLLTELAARRPSQGKDTTEAPKNGFPPARPLPWSAPGDSCPRRVGPPLWSRNLSPATPGESVEVTRIPALWEDLCVVSDNDQVLVLRAGTGEPAWPSGAPNDDGRIFEGDSDRDPGAGRTRNWPRPLHRPAVDGKGRCFCRVGVGGEPNRLSLLQNDASRIVAFDLARGEGRLLWSTPAATLPGEAHWSFTGSPLPVGENVLCVVRAPGTEALCGIASLDASTGSVRWVRPICTVISEGDPLYGREMLREESGRVVLNLIGLVAAVRLENGGLEWLRRDTNRRDRGVTNDPVVATLHPLLVGGRVYALTDDRRIDCLDAADGAPIWTCVTPGPVQAVMAASEGVVVAAGDCLWGIDATAGGLLWRFGYDDPEARGAGPGWVAGPDILWSTREDLFTIDLLTGLPLRRMPLTEGRIRGGVLTAGRRELLLTSPDGLSFFRLTPCEQE